MNESNIAPPLDLDLATVDTSMPLLANGIYDLIIEKAEVKKTNDQRGEYISLDMKTNAPALSQKGDNLGAGIHVFDNINLVPTGKATWDMVARNLGAFTQALGFAPGQAKIVGGRVNSGDWVPSLPGRTIRAKIGFAPEGTNPSTGKSFRAKNTVEMYLKQQ